jgi:hypothetical protein
MPERRAGALFDVDALKSHSALNRSNKIEYFHFHSPRRTQITLDIAGDNNIIPINALKINLYY